MHFKGTSYRSFRTAATIAALFAAASTVRAQTTVTLPITVTGEVRVRSEYEHLPAQSSDWFTYLRTRLGVGVSPATGVRMLVQIQDSRVLGSEGISAASAANVLELHQGYLQIDRALKARLLAIRAGRQELAFANERLLGVNNWSNLGRSLDGVRVTLSADTGNKSAPKWTLNAFAATVEERGRRFGVLTSDTHPNDRMLVALFGTRELARNTTLESTIMYDGANKYRRYRNSDRGTLYARARTTLAMGLRADVEGGLQFGHQQYTVTDTSNAFVSQSVRAWLLGARLATRALAARKVVIALGADVLSGDDTPANEEYSAFSTMYASNHAFYGFQDVIGDPAATTREHGLVDLLATSALNVSRAVTLRAEAHRFTMAAGDKRELGSELDVLLPVRVGTNANVELGYSMFVAGRGAPALGLGAQHSRRQWAYLQLRAGF